ncbi:zinc ribbon domain-containing protein [bacterium]|nr:MAG: zinc ribbon domain-containing protein [bacterium]
MECPNCGDLLREGARYCSKCGTRVRERPVPQPAEMQAPARWAQEMRPSGDRLENARVGYQAALTIWIEKTRMIWSRFNTMVVANSLILGAISLTIGTNHPQSAPFTRALCLVGLAVSLAWLAAHRRACQHNSYLLSSARELEGFLADPVVTVTRAAIFSQGNEVALTIDGEKRNLRLSWLARTGLAKTELFSYFVVAMLMVLYVAFLFLLWPM